MRSQPQGCDNQETGTCSGTCQELQPDLQKGGCLLQVFRAKLQGDEEVAVKLFKMSARIKLEVRFGPSLTACPDALAGL